jgi:hypothetical protein
LFNQGLDFVGKVHKPEQIADRSAGAADGVGGFLMGQAKFFDQAREGARLFQRIQVLALYVLNQRHRNGRVVRHIADDRRDIREAGLLRGAPAPLAGDNFVALRLAKVRLPDGPHDDRLNHALRLNRLRKLRQTFRAHIETRLILAPLQQIERQHREALAGRRRRGNGARRCIARGCLAKQSAKAAA